MTSATAADLHHLLRPRAAAPFDAADLRDPPAAYRGTPFWSWNGPLDRDRLLRQFEAFADMGMGGAHLHSRIGLATEYLGKDFLGNVAAVADRAAERGMLCWLYDEDRWPSGAAGGLVTKDAQYRNRFLVVTSRPYTGDEKPPQGRAYAARTPAGREVARWALTLVDGRLHGCRRLAAGDTGLRDGEVLWYAYFDIAPTSAWFNHQAYLDNLSPTAVRRFIEVTHEAYARTVGKHFGTTVPAIFTDEPMVTPSTRLGESKADGEVILPWTDDFGDSYLATWGEDLLDHLPELVFDLPGDVVSPRRWRYRDHVSERFAQAFADQIGAWCAEHGIAFTGHLMAEGSLDSQIGSLGEAMRQYRGYQLPGIDLLCDKHEFTTAKQAVSVSRQDGRPGALSELYGVTNWDFDLSGHKRQGDWQAALGITVRVHHLAWMSMRGNAKRDYPGVIGPQATFAADYRRIEDHFARVHLLLTRGAPRTRVAVVHPVESQWLDFGPEDATASRRSTRERLFHDSTTWLVHGLIDHDYIAESLLPRQDGRVVDGRLHVGHMAYDTVILPGLRTLRTSTLAILERFLDAGGRILLLGRAPDLVDAEPAAGRLDRLLAATRRVDADAGSLLGALADLREIDVRRGGHQVGGLAHQIRDDGDHRIVFLANTARDEGPSSPWGGGRPGPATVRLRGTWKVRLVDTFSGTEVALAARQVDGWTEVAWACPPCGSLLLRLVPGSETVAATPTPALTERGRLADPVAISRDEPNVLLLDRAEWSLDGEAWQPRTDTLLITDAIRRRRNWDPLGANIPQPWATPDDGSRVQVALRFRIRSEVALSGLGLAVEDPSDWDLRLDGRPLATATTTPWVDEDIRVLPVGDLAAGDHILEARRAVGRRDTLEWFHLLGDFGVRLAGTHATLTAASTELAWGDWCHQGLPFYAGNVTYHASVDHGGGRLILAIPQRSGALVRVRVDGQDRDPVLLPPWQVDCGDLPAGTHRIDLTLVGHRGNAFGALHNCDKNWHWWGPPAWFTSGAQRSENYRLFELGITGAPMVLG